ncbi:sulfurtransferase complex subunit TusB [Shewanella sp. JM162201]|uniref:Sulfurtransferase complex subunit TusB n=1 Tax=Shewanella jiangmenensis TaxID=2837387 RepID=A0ABS5V4Q4_9GAMM|nr:sulfurtransferase complex subunit TusB [Shewanella jiangmenensis]MBT1445446.1 sulfurtransferase complex subunit TusB [Shewanella jiangmenensis]
MILHHIQTTPSQSAALTLSLRYFTPGDGLLLSGDAVASVLDTRLQPKLTMKVLLLESDVIARGLTPLICALPVNIELIDYPRWVELSLHYKKVITW